MYGTNWIAIFSSYLLCIQGIVSIHMTLWFCDLTTKFQRLQRLIQQNTKHIKLCDHRAKSLQTITFMCVQKSCNLIIALVSTNRNHLYYGCVVNAVTIIIINVASNDLNGKWLRSSNLHLYCSCISFSKIQNYILMIGGEIKWLCKYNPNIETNISACHMILLCVLFLITLILFIFGLNVMKPLYDFSFHFWCNVMTASY